MLVRIVLWLAAWVLRVEWVVYDALVQRWRRFSPGPGPAATGSPPRGDSPMGDGGADVTAAARPASQPKPAPSPGQRGAAPTAPVAGSSELLQTRSGVTSIADLAVSSIAAMAAQEVPGARLGTGANIIGGTAGRMAGQRQRPSGVRVTVGESQATVDVCLRVVYPTPVHDTADSVRSRIIDRIQSMTGLQVVEVNVEVVDLVFPGAAQPGDRQTPGVDGPAAGGTWRGA